MANFFLVLDEIKTELKQIEETGLRLTEQLALLNQYLVFIFAQIKACENQEAANEYFEMLEAIQSTLAMLIYGQDIILPDSLWRFAHDFDHLTEERQFYFQKIRSGDYVF